MSLNTTQNKKSVIRSFPNLDFSQLEITSPKTDLYNCMAYAAGDQSKWWGPESHAYWPPLAPRTRSIIAFQKAFGTIGYTLTGNRELESGLEKIAVFQRDSLVTHVALQLEDGTWSSKLGPSFDISHDLEGLEGDPGMGYGEIAIIMQRSRDN